MTTYILFWFWLKHLWKNSTFAFTAILHLDIWVFIEQCSTLSYGLGKDEEMRRATRHAMIGMIKYRLLKVAVVLGQSKHIKATKSRQQYQGNNIKATISRQQYQGNNIKGGTISQLFSICCCRWQLGARSPINSEHWKPPNTIQDNTIQHHSIPCNWGPVVQ